MTNPIEPMQWLSMIASFLVVIALLFATLWVLRRMGGRSLRGQGGRIKVVESIWLAPRQRLALLRVDQQELLVAISQQQVNLLVILPASKPGLEADSQSACSDIDDGLDGGASSARSSPRPAPDAALSERFRQALRAWTHRSSGGSAP